MKKMLPICSLFFLLLFLIPSLSVKAAAYEPDFEPVSQGVILVNLDTEAVVYEKNADLRLEPASTTKIMTYIIAAEHISDLEGTMITAKKEVLDRLDGTGSSTMGLQDDETLSAMDLLHGLMIRSGNDASLVLADYVCNGDINQFVEMMNQKAQELGCQDTHFTNPHGLHDKNHYTTARDLYLITKYAMTLPNFMEISSKVSYVLPATNKQETRRITTTNHLINQNAEGNYYYMYAKGIKTGAHDQAGYCLVSTAIRNGYSYMCVALGAPSVDENGNSISDHGEMRDSKSLYQWAFSDLEMKTIVSETDTVTDLPLLYSWDQDTILLTAESNFSTILPAGISTSSVLMETNLPDEVEAPVKKGDVIGTATFSYAGQVLTTVNLVAAESVERSELLHAMDIVQNVVTSTWFIVIASVLSVLLAAYIVLAVLYNKKKKKLRKVKKYKDL